MDGAFEEVNHRAREMERRFVLPVGIAGLLVIPTIIVQQTAHVTPSLRTAAVVADWGIWFVFLAELIATTAVAERRGHWLLRHPLDIAVVVLSVPGLAVLFPAIRAVRLLRLTRLVRVAAVARVLFSAAGVRYASLLALITVLVGGDAFAELEHQNVANGLYWAVTTMTTVGYGDPAPATAAGRALAVVVMLVGIGFVAMITGAIAERFVRRDTAAPDAATTDLVNATERLTGQVAQLTARLAAMEQLLSADSGRDDRR